MLARFSDRAGFRSAGIAKMRIGQTTACTVMSLMVMGFVCGCGDSDSPSEPQPRRSLCTDVDYPQQNTSAYILPYPVGETYTVGQGNCVPPGEGSHARGARAEFAYDVLMPIGTTLLATRGGVVIYVEERFLNGTGVPGEENTVLIQHEDGTLSNYGHLTTMGAMVAQGDTVAQGDLIGISGNSGASSEPHLHFEILECEGEPLVFDPVVSFNPTCHSLPTTFRNTRSHPNGLVEGEAYMAESFD